MKIIVSIDAPHFNAGIVLVDGVVIEAAPIVSYMRGWNADKVREYIKRKRWTATQRIQKQQQGERK